MIDFLRNPSGYNAEGSRVCFIGQVNDEYELFEKMAAALDFPESAGGGWNGIDDCLRDLAWISEKEVVIVHTAVPQLSPMAWQTYISIVSYAVDSWENDPEHHLTIFFPEDAHPMVQAALRTLE